ncbi:transglutaminase family protein [bacterium]|nr:transglutaminase family protein [bacterium]
MRSHALAVTSIISLLGLWAGSLVEAAGSRLISSLSVIAVAGIAYNLASGKPALRLSFWNAAALAAFVFLVADYLAISRDIIASGTRFLSLILVLKLLSIRSGRDHAIVFAVAFFLILAAAASTVSAVFFAVLALYIVFVIWGMVVLNLRRDLDDSGIGTGAPEDLFGLPLFLSLTALSAACIVLTLAVFFSIPRMGVGILEAGSRAPLNISGFSERMEMDSIAGVQLDPAIVMRVEIKGGSPPEPLYFRGASLDFFDGSGWSRRASLDRLIKGVDGVFTFGGPGKRTLEQKVWLEPLDTEVLFAASNAYMVEGRLQSLWTDGSGNIRLPSAPFRRLEYAAWSDISGGRPARAPDGSYLDASYLVSSPEGHLITELARAASDGRTSALGKALAIEEFLHKNYYYTLTPRSGGGSGPLEDFLLHTKEGWCEHFATGMAMMLRSAGVPARIATGFLEGEWNEYGGYFIVRKQDAHSWVEAYIDGQGWMRFDPTPSSRRLERHGALFMYLDLLRHRWNRHIVNFSFSDQRALALAFEEKASGLKGLLAGLLPDKRPGIKGVLAVLLVFALAVSVAVMALRRARKGNAAQKAPRYYMEMLKALSLKGMRKGPGETPREFADRLGEADVVQITELYLRERYGGERPGRVALVRMEETLARIRKLKRP